MDTVTVQEIIKMINVKLKNLRKEYDEGMRDEEYYSSTSELLELKSDLKAMIKKRK